ncbi:unnamed protein product [Symbiodinium sp. CCMP2592]|nr:unnamed protein product [Symbiodinium sp. CCMP2592]
MSTQCSNLRDKRPYCSNSHNTVWVSDFVKVPEFKPLPGKHITTEGPPTKKGRTEDFHPRVDTVDTLPQPPSPSKYSDAASSVTKTLAASMIIYDPSGKPVLVPADSPGSTVYLPDADDWTIARHAKNGKEYIASVDALVNEKKEEEARKQKIAEAEKLRQEAAAKEAEERKQHTEEEIRATIEKELLQAHQEEVSRLVQEHKAKREAEEKRLQMEQEAREQATAEALQKQREEIEKETQRKLEEQRAQQEQTTKRELEERQKLEEEENKKRAEFEQATLARLQRENEIKLEADKKKLEQEIRQQLEQDLKNKQSPSRAKGAKVVEIDAEESKDGQSKVLTDADRKRIEDSKAAAVQKKAERDAASLKERSYRLCFLCNVVHD